MQNYRRQAELSACMSVTNSKQSILPMVSVMLCGVASITGFFKLAAGSTANFL